MSVETSMFFGFGVCVSDRHIVSESEVDGIETVLVMAACRFTKTVYGRDIVDSALDAAGLPR
jgi:hypothetical protein|eukprot:COSAG06_NODE_10275_length_1713_cov_2.664808_2_plen_62_part_00